MDTERKRARARALRAARVLSVAAGLALGSAGCAASHTGDTPPPDDARPPIADSGTLDSGSRDSGARDFGTSDLGPRDFGTRDSGTPDTGVMADAGECPEPTWSGDCCETHIDQVCCETTGIGIWDEAGSCCMTCLVGPLVPPSAPV